MDLPSGGEPPSHAFEAAGFADRLAQEYIKQGGTMRALFTAFAGLVSAPFEPPPRDEHGRASGGPLNRRAEIWMKSKEWLADPAGAQIPDSDALQADACGPGYSYDSTTRLVLEKKEDMRRRGALSPDEWDAVALTFAEPVVEAARVARFWRKLEYPDLGIV